MRILVVGAVCGGTVPMGKSICNAFVAVGQEASLLDFSTFEPQFLELRVSPDPTRIQVFMDSVRKRLLDEIISYQPEMILGMAQSPLNNPGLLAAFRRAGIKLCYWFVEDGQLFPYWKAIAGSFDHFFTIQQEPFFTELKLAGGANPYYLPTAFDDLAAPNGATSEPAIPVSFVGAPYPNRVRFFEKLDCPSLQIFGEGWDQHQNPAVRIGNRRVSESECRDIYGRSLVNINLHSSMDPEGFGTGDFVNPRTFEIAGLGAFQLTDTRQLLPLHFDPAGEIPAFGQWEAMRAAIEYFSTHADDRNAFAASARRRVLREHTYRHRALEIMSLVS
jgi:spore maturation protein CgeB